MHIFTGRKHSASFLRNGVISIPLRIASVFCIFTIHAFIKTFSSARNRDRMNYEWVYEWFYRKFSIANIQRCVVRYWLYNQLGNTYLYYSLKINICFSYIWSDEEKWPNFKCQFSFYKFNFVRKDIKQYCELDFFCGLKLIQVNRLITFVAMSKLHIY